MENQMNHMNDIEMDLNETNKKRPNRHVKFDEFGRPYPYRKKHHTTKRRSHPYRKNQKKPPTPPKKPPYNPFRPSRRNDELNDLSNLIIIFPEQFDEKRDMVIGGKDNTKKNVIDSNDMLCNNPLCDHKTLEENPEEPTKITIEDIKSIDCLITMGKAYHCKKQTTYKGINLRLMNNLVTPLTELNQMIGLTTVKKHMVDQILFFLQGFNTTARCNKCVDCTYNLPCVQNRTEMLHTVITGPPGVGKTCLARIIGKVYRAMGILSNGEFHEVARSDLIAKYLGQTAIKTQDMINKCAGGVMFIDEAYSLGHKENRDSFAKECLDTLNKNLSDKRDFLCIIAGYKNELEECFFNTNPGLTRRFTFRYDINEYDYNELLEIFKKKIEFESWSIDLSKESKGEYKDADLIGIFRKYREYFPNCGGDIETLFLQCKIVHSRRMPENRKTLNYDDIENGFKQFIANRKYDEGKKGKKQQYVPMYTN